MRIQPARLWLSMVVCLSFTVPVALIAAQDSTPDTTNFALTATALSGGLAATNLPFAATATALASEVQQETATQSPFALTATVLASTPIPATPTALPSAEVTTEMTVESEPTAAPTMEPADAETEVEAATEEATEAVVIEEEPTAEATSETTAEDVVGPTAEPTAIEESSSSTDEAVEAEPATVEGVSTLILIIGLGAVLAVGGFTLLRERYQDKQPASDE